MKVYTVNGRKVWLDKAPEGYEEPKKVAEVAPVVEEPKTKAKRATSNKARKAGNNK